MDIKQDKELDKTIEAADTNQEALNDEVEELITDKKSLKQRQVIMQNQYCPKAGSPKRRKNG